jgi:hypothetical protein
MNRSWNDYSDEEELPPIPESWNKPEKLQFVSFFPFEIKLKKINPEKKNIKPIRKINSVPLGINPFSILENL